MKSLAAGIRGLDYSSPEMAGKHFRKLKLEPTKIKLALAQAKKLSAPNADMLVRGILATIKTKKQYPIESRELFSWARSEGKPERQMVMQALHDDGGEAASLFMVHQISRMTKNDARNFMKDYLVVGGEISAVARWLQLAGMVLRKQTKKGTAGAVVDALEDAGEWVVDTLEDTVDVILESAEAVVDAIVNAGVAMVTVLGEIASWTVDQIGDALLALLEAGVAMAEIVGGIVRMAYKACAQVVAALLALGKTVAEILAEVVEATYWQLRRIVNGIVKALGPIGDILEWAWNQVGAAADQLLRSVMKAIRYAGGVLTGALEWAYDKGTAAMEAVIKTWEAIGEGLIEVYKWAKGMAADVWDYIGQATSRLGNSIYYVLEYLKEDYIAGIFHFVKGLMKAAFAVAEIVGWMVGQSLEIAIEIMKGLLEVGVTLSTLVVNVIAHPRNAMQLLLQTFEELDNTMEDVYKSVVEETGEEFLEQVTHAYYEIGKAVKDMLLAVAEVATGAFWTVVSILMNTLNTYRSMTAQEIQDARQVFGNHLEYDKIYFAEESVANDIIFGIQGLGQEKPDSRAFTTNTLINFDPDAGEWDRPTMIHELLHVWQYLETGSFFMTEAIYAQNTQEKYNYGYDENQSSVNVPTDYAGNTRQFDEGFIAGLGAEPELQAAGGDFDSFNREQQAQIIMHYYVRRHLLNQPRAAWEPWLQYAQAVNPDLA